MLDRAVRIGMIGCGTQANVHFAGIKTLGADQAMVAAVCDLDDERLAAACQLWPAARAAKDYRDMLAPGDLDLVIVATMPNTHEAMSLASLDAGACVLCEKPFMMNAAQAEAVLAKAAETGLQVQLGTNMRYMPSSRYLHDLVQGGTIGEPVFAKAWGCHDDPPVWGPHYHPSHFRRRSPRLDPGPHARLGDVGRRLAQSAHRQCGHPPPLPRQARTQGRCRHPRALRRRRPHQRLGAL